MTNLLGGMSRRTLAATFPPDRFYCLLDELPLHLVPRHTFSWKPSREAREAELYLNPDCKLRSAKDLPKKLDPQEELSSAFALQGTIAWIWDPETDSRLPFWLGPAFEEVVRGLGADQPVPETVPDHIRTVLAGAGILIPQRFNSQRTAAREYFIANAKLSFREKGYSALPGLIHPFHVAALRRYYRRLLRKGWMKLGDEQSSLRYVVHNEPVAQFFHREIARTLSAVAGEAVKPSYVYLASYQSGAELKKHVDREQCEFSITLALDFSPEPELPTPWPIHLDTTYGKVTVFQALGDGLAYRGTRLPHYRDKLGPGQTSTSIFFHYVSENFMGPLT
ncbi:MAG: hypothetical protein WA485_12150 [Candidatus Sulfotelmatobacter sp.]